MRFVETAPIRPARCAVLPQIGPNHPRGYIDTGSELIGGLDNHVYVSVVAVEQMARMIGWQSPEDAAALNERVDGLARELAEAHAELQEADKFAQAAEYTLGRFGEKVRNKPGRKSAAEKVSG